MSEHHDYWFASYAVYELSTERWRFVDMVFKDEHPMALAHDNWAGGHTLISFQAISRAEYEMHGEHIP